MQKDNLPRTTIQALSQIDTGDKNRDIIIAYLQLEDGHGIVLSEIQERLLERWQYADELIRRNVGKKNREELADLIKARWGIHRATAYQDIVNAEYVYSSSTPINRAYEIGLRIEFLKKQIRLAAAVSDFKSVAMMEKSLKDYIEMYPENRIKQSPRTIIFNVDASKLKDEVISIEEAEFEIEEALKKIDYVTE